MKFAYIPKGIYTIGQIIEINRKKLRVESYSHTGKNLIACTLEDAPKFERVVCICTDEPFIEETK